MADFTGQNIQDTYQRVVQVDQGQLQDGTGSALPISFNGDDVIVPGAVRANSYIVSESILSVSSGSTVFGNSHDDTHTFSGSVDIKDRTNTNHNTINASINIRQDAVDRSQIANGFGGSIDFYTQRGSANPSGARTGRISNFIFAGAQGISDQHAMKFTIRNDDTQVDALTIAPGSPDSKALIGIMDTSPSFTLDVNGDFRATGDINAGGNIVGDSATTITGINTIATSGNISTLANLSSSQNVIGANLLVSTGRVTGDASKATQLVVNGFVTATHITASGNIQADGQISASGLIVASNLSGTNTGDQDLSNLITNAQTSSFALTTEVVANSSTASFAITGSNVEFADINATGNIVADGNITASNEILAAHLNTTGKVRLDGKTALFNDSNELRLGYLDTWEKIVYGKQTTDQHEFHGNITASGDISSSGLISAANFHVPGQGRISFDNTDTDDQFIKGLDNSIVINGDDLVRIRADHSVDFEDDNNDAQVSINGNSGHITASGTLWLSGSENIYLNNGEITASGNISASGDIIATGTGSFGRLEATSDVALQLLNDQAIVFENSAGNEFSQIKMNTSDNMVFQNLRSDKDVIFRAGNSSNEGHFIIQPGGDTSTNIAKFGKTADLDLSGNFTASGNIKANYIETAKIPLIQYISTEATSTAQGRVLASGTHDNATDSFALEWDTPLFHDTDFFETGSVSPTTSGAINTFAVKQTGRYEINCNVTFRSTAGARPGINLGIFTSSRYTAVGDFRPKGPAAHAYVRVSGTALGSTAAIPGFVIQLTSGSAVSMKVDLKNDFGATGNTLWSGSLSHFNMKKIG